MKRPERKKIISDYKARQVVGGVFAIKNKKTGKFLLDGAQDLTGSRNRFEFAKKTGAAIPMKLEKDWRSFGADCFVFEVLEELKKTEGQTSAEFAEEIKILKEMWFEKINPEELY